MVLNTGYSDAPKAGTCRRFIILPFSAPGSIMSHLWDLPEDRGRAARRSLLHQNSRSDVAAFQIVFMAGVDQVVSGLCLCQK